MNKVILYYKFVPVADPAMTVRWQRELCNRLDLKGRVIVSKHGINGTLGQNIARIKQDDLHSHIAYVPQEPLLFHRTLADNIAYGNPEADQKEIEAVAKMAYAHEFIKEQIRII